MNIFKRALMWTLLFFAVNTIALLYLPSKAEIKNADVILVFLPILLWACSTEIWGKRFKKQKFYKYALIDTVAKAIAFVCAELIYSKTAVEAWYFVCLVGYIVLAILSITMTILIMLCEKQYYENLQSDAL